MSAIGIGLIAGVLIGLLYLYGSSQRVRRTLASSVLLGVVVGIVVELARRPLFTAVFVAVATILLAEFLRWGLSGLKRKQ